VQKKLYLLKRCIAWLVANVRISVGRIIFILASLRKKRHNQGDIMEQFSLIPSLSMVVYNLKGGLDNVTKKIAANCPNGDAFSRGGICRGME
jgi:hypothetical protein